MPIPDSSHSWSTKNTLPRVYAPGGMVTPYAGSSSGFANDWEQIRSAEVRGELGDQYYGLGYGADANGFGSQGGAHTGAVSQTDAQKLNKLAKRLVRVAST